VPGVTKEIEAKFYLPQLDDVRARIETLGGHLETSRILERNLRFDTTDGDLSDKHTVLRLRQDRSTVLTYKRAVSVEERTEIEIGVDDFETAKLLLEMLGFEVFFIYEKYRETHILGACTIMLDELPFGDFVEIEGHSLADLEWMASKLGLPWKNRVKMNYLSLFQRLQQKLQLPFRDATFDNFSDMAAIQPDDLGLEFAA
jgi:adenylate cyclase class 2